MEPESSGGGVVPEEEPQHTEGGEEHDENEIETICAALQKLGL